MFLVVLSGEDEAGDGDDVVSGMLGVTTIIGSSGNKKTVDGMCVSARPKLGLIDWP